MFNALTPDEFECECTDDEVVETPEQLVAAPDRVPADRTCSGCGQVKTQDLYSKGQWKAKSSRRLCKLCTKAKDVAEASAREHKLEQKAAMMREQREQDILARLAIARAAKAAKAPPRLPDKNDVGAMATLLNQMTAQNRIPREAFVDPLCAAADLICV